jgi:hypothetical protein
MKKFILFFCFILAIMLPSASFAKGSIHLHELNISQKQTIPNQNLIQEDIFLDNDYLISEAEDDMNDAVRKTFSFTKTSTKTISFKVEYYSAKFLNKAWSNKYFYNLNSSLFIFFSVFRL